MVLVVPVLPLVVIPKLMGAPNVEKFEAAPRRVARTGVASPPRRRGLAPEDRRRVTIRGIVVLPRRWSRGVPYRDRRVGLFTRRHPLSAGDRLSPRCSQPPCPDRSSTMIPAATIPMAAFSAVRAIGSLGVSVPASCHAIRAMTIASSAIFVIASSSIGMRLRIAAAREECGRTAPGVEHLKARASHLRTDTDYSTAASRICHGVFATITVHSGGHLSGVEFDGHRQAGSHSTGIPRCTD